MPHAARPARGVLTPQLFNLFCIVYLYKRLCERVPGSEEYVYTSIVDPNAMFAEGYFANVMPANYTEQMSEEEIQHLVAWLLSEER